MPWLAIAEIGNRGACGRGFVHLRCLSGKIGADLATDQVAHRVRRIGFKPRQHDHAVVRARRMDHQMGNAAEPFERTLTHIDMLYADERDNGVDAEQKAPHDAEGFIVDMMAKTGKLPRRRSPDNPDSQQQHQQAQQPGWPSNLSDDEQIDANGPGKQQRHDTQPPHAQDGEVAGSRLDQAFIGRTGHPADVGQ